MNYDNDKKDGTRYDLFISTWLLRLCNFFLSLSLPLSLPPSLSLSSDLILMFVK